MINSTTKLRQLMDAGPMIVAPGCYDALTAKLIEHSGFSCAYLSGGSFSATYLGAPDLALTTVTDLTTMANNITLAVDIPIVADMETGFGSVLNVRRAVRLYERAGIAGAHIEDQTAAKHCGHMEGKSLVSTEEMVTKIDAALEARSDPDFVIIARSDAITVEGFDAALERGRRYADAGADMVYIEAPRTLDELRAIPGAIPVPVMVGQPEFGLSPLLEVSELEKLGVRLVIYPRTIRLLMVRAALDGLAHIRREGSTRGLLDLMAPDEEMQNILATPEAMSVLARSEMVGPPQ